MNSHLSSVDIAHSLAKRGKRFNAGIVKRFKDYFPEKELSINAKSHIFEKEHMRLIECAAQTLSWLQPRIDDNRTEAIKLVKFYRKSIIEARYNTDSNERASIINERITKYQGVNPSIGVPIYFFPIIELNPMPKIVKDKPVAT